jgi:glycosyltransferase involved in cell wall biosynthesis
MKIWSRQFLARNHSWGVVGRNLMQQFVDMGHDVHLFSTDGKDKIPDSLMGNLVSYTELNGQKVHNLKPSYREYDLQIAYTAMKNFKHYLNRGSKNRFGIYNYDGSVLPKQWKSSYRHVDLVLPSSEYAKKVFVDAKIPESHLRVVPHGINLSDFDIPENEIYQLKTKKSVKILNVCGQVHRRKNLSGMLEAYGKAFSKDDDVCLVLKVTKHRPVHKFELSARDIYQKWRKENPQAGEVEMIYDYIPKIESLFLACDIHFSLSNIECFHIPSLQALGAGMVTIQSGYGGHTDFLHQGNSLLVEGKMGRCPPKYQYWHPSPYAEMFIPDIDDATDKLKHAVENLESLKEKFGPEIKKTTEKFTWTNAAKQILELVK